MEITPRPLATSQARLHIIAVATRLGLDVKQIRDYTQRVAGTKRDEPWHAVVLGLKDGTERTVHVHRRTVWGDLRGYLRDILRE